MTPSPTVPVEQFFGCDLRVGTVIACMPNEKARKPAYVMTLDFGPLGVKTSSAQLTTHYTPQQLLGRQVVAVVNFPARNVAGTVSECLVLGADDGGGGIVLLATERPLPNGARIH